VETSAFEYREISRDVKRLARRRIETDPRKHVLRRIRVLEHKGGLLAYRLAILRSHRPTQESPSASNSNAEVWFRGEERLRRDRALHEEPRARRLHELITERSIEEP